MSNIAELVEQLAVETTNGDGVTGPSLLRVLYGARYASVGTNAGSKARSDSRIPLNADAHEMWEDITGQIESLCTQVTDKRPTTDPSFNLLAWWAVFSAASVRGETTLLMHEVAYERLARWAQRIRELVDPPMLAPLRGVSCLECGLARVTVGEGFMASEVDALIAQVVDGELRVTCRACSAKWRGDVEVIHLGRRSGIEIDPDRIREAKMPVVAAPVDDAAVGPGAAPAQAREVIA